ncbi:hypothetical protein [Persephonella sp.]
MRAVGVIATIITGLVFSLFSGAFATDPLMNLVMEVESAKARDVKQPSGFVIAVYDPYGKNLKIFHYWLGYGFPMYSRATNTDCTRKTFTWLRVKHPTWKFEGDWTNNYECRQDSRFADVMACRKIGSSEHEVDLYYDVDDNRILNISPVPGAFCKRVVNVHYLKERLGISDIIGETAGTIATYDGSGTIENAYIKNISYEKALKLTTEYMFVHKIVYGIFTVQTFDVYTTKSSSLFKTKITYHYVEKPLYYVIMTGVNAGTDLGMGYRLLNGQAVGNNLIRENMEIYTKSKSGWTGFGVLVFQAAMVALTYGAAGAAFAAAGASVGTLTVGTTTFSYAALGAAAQAATYIAQDIKADVFTNLWGDKVYETGSITEEGLLALSTAGTVGLVMNDDYAGDTNIITGDGASHITSRVISGDDTNLTLSGFYEAKKEVDAYENFDAPAGSFITLQINLYE